MSDNKLPTVILDFITGHEATESLHKQAEKIEVKLKGTLQSSQVKPESSSDSIIVGAYNRDDKKLSIYVQKSGGKKSIADVHFQHNFSVRSPDLGVAIVLDHDERVKPEFTRDTNLETFFDVFAPEIYQILSKAYGDVPLGFQAKKEKVPSPK